MLSFNYCALTIKKSVFSVTAIIAVVLCFLLQVQNAEARIATTVSSGAWGTASNWSDNTLPADGDIIEINHVMNFTNVNVNIGANTTFNFNAGANGTSIPLSLGMSSATSVLNVYSNISFAGGINLNAGIIHVYSGANLTVTNQINQAGTLIIIDAGANFNVTGNYLNNGGNIAVDGLLAITGNYNGQNALAVVTGSGDITTTGSMIGINQSSIFGVINPTCYGPNCSGRNLCGRAAYSLPASAAYCTTAIVLTGSVSSSATGATYQWQSSPTNTEAGFSDISGATNATVSVTPATTTYYRVKIKINNCTSLSPVSVVTKSYCTKTWAGLTTDWHTGSNWNPSGVPDSNDDVVIPNISVKPVISGTANAKDIIIHSGSSLGITASGTLNLYGNFANAGTLNAAPGSTLAVKGTGSQSISGTPTLYNLSIDQGTTNSEVTLFSETVVKGKISLLKGKLNTDSYLTIDFTFGGNIAYHPSDAGSIDGVVTGHRSGVGAKTHYVSSPFIGVTSAQVPLFTPLWVSPYWKMYSRNFSAQSWAAITNLNTPLTVGTGYTLSFVTASHMAFTGTYDHYSEFTTPSYDNADSNKFLLVGNPYPATLDWNNEAGWTKTNVSGTIYFWDGPNNRSAYYNAISTPLGLNGGSQYIPAMSAFMIATTGGGGTTSLEIKKSACTSALNAVFMRTGQDKSIRLKLTAENATIGDEAIINFIDDATFEFDAAYDGHKMMSSGLTPSLYTTLNGVNYAINVLPSLDEVESIPVSAKIPADGNYTLDIVVADPTVQAVLIDKKLGTENLVSGPSYTFSGQKSDDANRFELQLRTSTTTGTHSSNNATGLSIYSSNKGFVVKTDQYLGDNASIEILDVAGKKVNGFDNVVLSSNSTFFPLNIAEGTYLVKLITKDQLFAELIILVK